MRKRVLVASIAIVIAVSSTLYAGGGGEQESQADVPSTGSTLSGQDEVPFMQVEPFSWSTLTNDYSLPLVDDRTTLTFTRYGSAGTDRNQQNAENTVMQHLFDITNVEWEWNEIVGRSDYDDAILAAFAANNVKGDLVMIPNGFDFQGAVNAGRLVDFREIAEEVAPNLTHLYTERKEILGLITAPDGGWYLFPNFQGPMFSTGVHIRGDWLDRLGLEPPTTVAELEEVLKQFRDNDMNGNGDPNDELPFTYYCFDCMVPRFNEAWGLNGVYAGNWMWQSDQYGQLFFVPASGRFREILEMWNRWYREDLIQKDYNVAWGGEQYQMGNNTIGAAPASPTDHFSTWGETVPGAYWYFLEPLEGPYGDKGTHARVGALENFAIPSSSENAELVVKFIDYQWATRDGLALTSYGLPENYTFSPSGVPVINPEIVAMEGDQRSATLGSAGFGPVVRPDESWTISYTVLGNSTVQYQRMIEMRPYFRPSVLLSPFSDPTQDQILNQYWYGDEGLQNFVSTMNRRFIAGEEPLANWDQYVEQLYDLGLEEVQSVFQAKYETMLRGAGFIE